MGMFDDVICKYPLPGNPAKSGEDILFQTTNLSCLLLRYTVTEDGHLVVNTDWEDRSTFAGTIEIYRNNVVACGPGIYTRDGEDAHYLRYRITFVSGTVVDIKEVENRHESAVKYRPPVPCQLSEDELTRIAERKAEKLIGKIVYVWRGGQEHGYDAVVVAESELQVVVRDATGKFEIIARSQRDNCFFDSEEDGRRHRKEKEDEWQRQLDEFDDEIANRTRPTKDEP